MMATGDPELMENLKAYKETLKQKIVKANEDLSKVEYKFKTN
jgi:5-(carboxyamino)imidazole ribonucleotide mutase